MKIQDKTVAVPKRAPSVVRTVSIWIDFVHEQIAELAISNSKLAKVGTTLKPENGEPNKTRLDNPLPRSELK